MVGERRASCNNLGFSILKETMPDVDERMTREKLMSLSSVTHRAASIARTFSFACLLSTQCEHGFCFALHSMPIRGVDGHDGEVVSIASRLRRDIAVGIDHVILVVDIVVDFVRVVAHLFLNGVNGWRGTRGAGPQNVRRARVVRRREILWCRLDQAGRGEKGVLQFDDGNMVKCRGRRRGRRGQLCRTIVVVRCQGSRRLLLLGDDVRCGDIRR